jgi:hypothetical protein
MSNRGLTSGLESSPIPVLAPLPAALNETGDDYPYVVAVLGDQRVIESSDRVQWIVQQRKGRQWRNKYFCRTKAGVLLYAGRTEPNVAPPPPPPELLALPDRFEETT